MEAAAAMSSSKRSMPLAALVRMGPGEKSSLQLARNPHIARQQQLASEGVGDRPHIWLGLVVEIGSGERRPRGGKGTRTARSDARLVGNANDEAAFAMQAWRGGNCPIRGCSSRSDAVTYIAC